MGRSSPMSAPHQGLATLKPWVNLLEPQIVAQSGFQAISMILLGDLQVLSSTSNGPNITLGARRIGHMTIT